jgi:hypothetical protein
MTTQADYTVFTNAGDYIVTLNVYEDGTADLWDMTDARGNGVDLSDLFYIDPQDPTKQVSFHDHVLGCAINQMRDGGGYGDITGSAMADHYYDLTREVA